MERRERRLREEQRRIDEVIGFLGKAFERTYLLQASAEQQGGAEAREPNQNAGQDGRAAGASAEG